MRCPSLLASTPCSMLCQAGTAAARAAVHWPLSHTFAACPPCQPAHMAAALPVPAKPTMQGGLLCQHSPPVQIRVCQYPLTASRSPGLEHLSAGRCTRGSRCTWAHGQDEVRVSQCVVSLAHTSDSARRMQSGTRCSPVMLAPLGSLSIQAEQVTLVMSSGRRAA